MSEMSDLAPLLQRFFTDKLDWHLNASPHTKADYADTFRLLPAYAQQATGITPSALTLADLDADLIGGFLQHLETERGNSAAPATPAGPPCDRSSATPATGHPTRSRRSARSSRYPRNAPTPHSCRSPPIPKPRPSSPRRTPTPGWDAVTDSCCVWASRPVCVSASFVSLRVGDLQIGPHSQLQRVGKKRKQRVIPLPKNTVQLLAAWLDELPPAPDGPSFPTSTGTSLTRAAVGKLVARHVDAAAEQCPSLAGKNITPHTLRHTCAMSLLHAGIDIASIALWLGHANIQTTQTYLHADLETQTTHPGTSSRRR